MKGWKTLAAGIGTIMLGLSQLAMTFTGNGDTDMQTAVGTVLAGLAILGIGHKIEKAG